MRVSQLVIALLVVGIDARSGNRSEIISESNAEFTSGKRKPTFAIAFILIKETDNIDVRSLRDNGGHGCGRNCTELIVTAAAISSCGIEGFVERCE